MDVIKAILDNLVLIEEKNHTANDEYSLGRLSMARDIQAILELEGSAQNEQRADRYRE